MKREVVESSNLASVFYDSKRKILEIEFNHGGLYQYIDVPKQVFENLLKAPSHGKYFVHNIKRDYRYLKV